MVSTTRMDKNYSTTRLLTKGKPALEQKPEYKLEAKLFLSPNSKRKGEGGLRTEGWFKKSDEIKPLISIVTVVYNGEKHLEQTIKSVLDQTYDNVEYIIIDGGSTDGTLNIIKKYEDQIDYWVSEPDSGIYNAMNKGASLCQGDYIAFLNADDWYNLNALTIVSNAAKNNSDYICSDVTIVDTNHSAYLRRMRVNFDNYRMSMPIGHPALFVKRVYVFEFGFDEKYTVVADYDFVIKLIENKLLYAYSPKPFVNFREGGISTTQNLAKERFRMHCKHFGIMLALYGFILGTDQPVISNMVQFLVKIKHVLQQRKKFEIHEKE